MDQSDASTASFGAAAAAADRMSASHNSSPGTIEVETLTAVREDATGRARSRSPSAHSTPPGGTPRSGRSPRETRRRTDTGAVRVLALQDGSAVPVPSDSEAGDGARASTDNLQLARADGDLNAKCAQLLAEVHMLNHQNAWMVECEQRQNQIIQHETEVHEVVMAHLEECYVEGYGNQRRISQLTESRDCLLSAAHDLQYQMDTDRVAMRDRLTQLGEYADRNSAEMVSQVVNIGTEEIQAISAERDRAVTEVMTTIADAENVKDLCRKELVGLQRQSARNKHEYAEEMKMREAMYANKIKWLSEENEELNNRSNTQDKFILSIREQLKKANEELTQTRIQGSDRPFQPSSAELKKAEAKVNMLEEDILRKERMLKRLQEELIESSASEAQLKVALKLKPPDMGSEPSVENEMMTKLRAELERTEKLLRSEEKEAIEYYEGMMQNQQDMMEFETHASRLRDERNKYRKRYEEERTSAENAAATEHGAASSSSSGGSKISRKEDEKINIPAWPKIHDLEVWKSQVVAAVVTASGDEKQEDWIQWLSDAFRSPYDPFLLETSGEARFASIDAKLGITLHTIIHAAGERSHDVQLKVRQMMQRRARGTTPGMVKGREMLALIVDSFRSADNVDVMYASKHLFDLKFPGDNQLSRFLGQWDEIISGMDADDMLPDKALRNLLWDKIKDSKVMALDLSVYDNMLDKDPDKTYQKLREIMTKWIRKSIETTNKKEREKAFGNIVKATPAAEKKDPKAKPKNTKADPPKHDAAPVLPQANPKDHNKKDKKQDRGRSATKSPKGDRGRSATPADTSKIGCAFHFHGKNGCSRGDKCKFSHQEKHKSSAKKPESLKGDRSKSPGGRSSSPKPMKDQVCWNWQKGSCRFGDKCRRQHHAAPATKQEAKGKAKPKPAAPAFMLCGDIESDDEDVQPALPNVQQGKLALRFKVRFDDQANVTTFTCDPGNELNNRPLRKKKNEVQKVDTELISSLRALRVSNIAARVAHAKGKMMELFYAEHIAKAWVQITQDEGIEVNVDLSDFNTREVVRKDFVDYTIPGTTMFMAVERYDGPPIRFIMDTGCGHDLISREKVNAMGLTTKEGPKSVSFMTANGVTSTSEMVDINVDELPMRSEAHVLESTPSVFSIGKRCMEQGYSFIWPANQLPYLIDQNANKIPLSVHDNIPYIKVNDDDGRCLPRPDGLATILHRILSGVGHEDEVTAGQETQQEELPPKKPRRRRRKKKDNQKGRDGESDINPAVAGVEEEPEEHDDDRYSPEEEYDGEEPRFDRDHEGQPEEAGGDEHGGDADSERGESDIDEDEEGLLEVDVVDGEARLSKPGVLKNEAKSILHLMTHRYKNPYCKSCVRAKMKHYKTRKGAFKRKLKAFGDLITFDLMNTQKMARDGIMPDKDILVIRDQFTGVIWGYPLKASNSDEVVQAMKHYIGKRKVTNAYADDAPQFESALKELRIPLDQSLPGHPQNNSLAERNNQFMMLTTSTCLLEAGLPPCFWPFAVECVSHLLNIEKLSDGSSAWLKLHKSEFPGMVIPLGAKVFFKPSDARERDQDHKFDPKSIPGIFAGYVMGTGMNWSRKYKVWAISDFAQQNLGYDAERPLRKLITPHITEKIFQDDGIEFPLKKEYERLNSTLEGMKVLKERSGSPDAPTNPELPDPDDSDDQDDDDDAPDPPDGDLKSKASAIDAIEDKKTEELTEKKKEDYSGPDHYSVGGPGDNIIYLNNDGEHVKIAKDGRLYRVGSDGRRLFHNSPRPKDYLTPEEWQKLSVKDRAIAKKAGKHVDRVVDRLSKKAKGLGSSTDKKEDEEPDELLKDLGDAKKGDEGDSEKKSKKDKKDKKTKKDKKSKKEKKSKGKDEEGEGGPSLAMPTTFMEWDTDDDDDPWSPKSYTSESTCVPSDEEFLTDWDESAMWEDNDDNLAMAAWKTENVYNPLNGQICCCITGDPIDNDVVDEPFPTMPCVVRDTQHRPKLMGNRLFNAVVSRPVSRAEILSNKKAMQSMLDEWGGLWDEETFDGSWLREYDEIVATSKKKGEEVHLARVHGICVEKNYQLPDDDPKRKFKGRGVLLGDQVKNQNFEAALFQDLGNSPATFEAARWADFYGCLEGNDVQVADAIRAYIQALLGGVPCWAELPWEAWPKHLQEEITRRGLKRPMCRVNKALYGHPDSGTMWEQHCDESVRALEFKPVGPEWPSMYYHEKLDLLLVIYVDDLKLAGPKENLKKGWDLLRSKLRIEPETEVGLYLGCVLSKGEDKLADGSKVTTMTYDMSALLKMSVVRYLDIVGKDTVLKKVATPMLPDVTKDHPSRAPCSTQKGLAVTCTWCGTCFSPDQAASKARSTDDDVKSDAKEQPRGTLAPHAASLLMKLLYAARIARFDLLRAITVLARNVTKWTVADDAKLHHLMCYVHHSADQKMVGWVGGSKADLSLALFADADYAGCGQSLKSTSGAHMHVQGKRTRFPLAGGSKRQGCVSHSTPEAGIVAADYALRTLGIPSISAWETLMRTPPRIVFYDDNQAMINVMRSGRNPTMRHMERTHGISITWLYEMFKRDYLLLVYEVTARMAADIHTKGFDDANSWKHACMLINILSEDGLRSQALLDLMKPTHDGLSYAKQLQKDRHSKVPTYPYTTIPVVPPQLYQPGLSSKEGLQEIPGCDPYVMVRTPKLYRLRPPRAPPDMAYLRSTWILQDAQWQQIEDKVDPNLEPVRFDRWVERAFFQFHPLSSPLPAASAPASGHFNAATLPRLLFSLRPLVQCRELQQTLRDSSLYLSIHHCSTSALHVLNALTRLVHGGNGGSGGSSMIFDNFVSDPEEQEHSVHDHWEVDEEARTLTRIHSSPRRKAFCPGDAPSCPVDMSRIKDDRMTYRQGSQFESSDFEDCVKDYWRHSGGGTHTKTHLRWIGKTVFTLRGNDAESENEEAQSAAIALCSTPKRMKTIPLKDIIVPTFVSVSKAKSEESKEHRIVDVNLRRHDGEIAYRYQFVLCEEDDNLAARDEQMVIDLYDIGKEPAFILLCSEECNHFTHLAAKHDCTIVTVSQSDDLTSPYGIARALAAVRSEKDAVMFAGPCTGGSAWSRYNAKVSDAIAKSIELKRALYWDLWERFETVMTRVLRIGAAALFELPRYCAYWKDQRVQRLLSGTDCDCHVFDGCMYGLGAEFNDSHSNKKLIKKPWEIVSWNLEFGDQLSRTCDKSHSHRDCAGKYTKTTQLYNKKIVGIILKTVTKRIAGFQKSEKMMHAVPCLMIRALGSSFNERSVCDATSNETVYTCDEHGTQISHVRRIEPHGIHDFQACCVCLCDHSTASPVRFSDVAMASVGGVMNYNSNTSGYPTFIIKILDGLVEMKERGQITLPPRMSRSTHGLDVVEAWIAVGIPPLVPLSINYAMSRTKSDDTKFLTASLKKLVGYMNEEEKKEKTGDLARRYKLSMATIKGRFGNDASGVFSNLSRYLVEPEEIGAIDDLWDDVRDFINSGRLNDTMVAYQQWRNLSGSANESMNMREAADPSDHVYATRLESYYTIFSSIFYHTSDKLTSRNAKEKVQELIETVNREIRNMALAIRVHNSDSALDKIHVIDVLEGLIARKRGLPKYRSAVQNHMETFLGSMSVMVQYLDNCKPPVALIIPEELRFMREKVMPMINEWIPVEPTMFRVQYNAAAAESGRQNEYNRRSSAFKSYTEYIEEMKKKIEDKVIPSLPFWDMVESEGPEPPDVAHRPKWCPPLQIYGDFARPRAKPMPRAPRPPPPSSSFEQQNFSERPSDSSTGHGPASSKRWGRTGGSESTGAASRDISVTTWFRMPLPMGSSKYYVFGKDYFSQDMKVYAMVSTNQVPSGHIVEGPCTVNGQMTWLQYLRRLTSYLMFWHGGYQESVIDRNYYKEDAHWFAQYTNIYDSTQVSLAGGLPSPRTIYNLCYPMEAKVIDEAELELRMRETLKGFIPSVTCQPATRTNDGESVHCEFIGAMKTSKVILMSDFEYITKSNSGKQTVFAQSLLSLGWDKVINLSCTPEYKKGVMTGPYGFINFVHDRIDDVKRHEPTSIHVWLSLSNLVTAGEKGTYKTVIVPTDFVPRLRDVIVKLDACCQLPTFVRICADVEFHHAVGSFGKIANMIKDELSLNGMMSTTSDRFWRAISVAGSGHPYSMKSGTSLVHAVMEKHLFREKMLASCFMAPDPLTEANSLHDPNLEHVLQDKERLYQYLFGDSVRGSHAYQSTAEPSGENESERRKREKVRRENKMPWMDEYWGVLQPEPIYSRTQRWYVIDDFKEGEEICCDYCLVCNPIDSDVKDDCYAECINGAANRCRGMSAEDYVQKRFHACARLLHNFGMGQTVSSPTIAISEMNPHDDLMKFLHEAMIIFNENPGFQKEISFFGGIRLSSTMTENFFKTRRGPSIHVEKQIVGSAKYYQGSYDLGNVCYTKYLKTILEPDVFRTIFGDDPTEERVGDMVEALLSMFEIAQLFRHMFRRWGDIEALRTGLEESIKRVTASLYDRTTYENRKRSMIRTMDPHSDEAANVALILVRMRTMPLPEFDIDHFFEIGKEPEQGTEATDQPEAEGVDMETEGGQEKEEQDVDMSDPKTSILQAIDEFERKIGQAEFCIHCMESGHTTLNCEKTLSSSPSVTSVLSDWKKRVKGEVAPDDVPSGHPTEEPKKKKQRASPTPDRKVDSEFRRKEMLKARVVQCDNAEPGQPEEIEWIRLLNGEPDPGSYLVLESKYGNPIMIPRFQKLESLAVEVQDDTYSEDDAKISKLLGMIEESGVYPEYDNTEWQELFEEIVYRRAMKDYDSRPCPNCLGEVDVRLTICPHCVAVLIANGKLTHVVPKETRDRNQRSSPKDIPASSSGETTSAAGANIDEVIKNARKTAEEVIEIEESEGEEEEEVPIILKERPDEAEGEPEYREVPQDGYGNELPKPFPFAIDELPQEAAIPIDHNFAVTQQFDLRLMKLIKGLANATFDINCFENREDVLRMFDDGQRHDTPHNRWPIVPNDPDTGFPRRLKRAEVVGMSRWTDDVFAAEAWQIYEFHANVVHPMMITAIRCGLSHKYLKEVGSTQRSMSDPKARKSETQDEIIEKLAFISNFIRRMIKKTFGASRYSYYQKPDDESTAPYKFIDISPAIKSERKNVTKEILVACRYYGIEVSAIQAQKLKSFEEQIRAGNPRNVELIKDYIGFVGADYMRQLTNG